MMTRKYLVPVFLAAMVYSITACKKETSEIHLIPAFLGDTTTLSGLVKSDEAVNAGYSVFMDFSKNVQSRAQRVSWDFAVYTGTANRLIINHSMGATAIALNKTSLAAVTESDTVSLETAKTLILGANAGISNIADPVAGTFTDYLNGTVFGELATDEASSKVYVVNRGTAGELGIRQWYKMKVTLLDQKYKIDFALIKDSARISSLTIRKNDSYNFKYASFTANQPIIEPSRLNWDIEWGWSTYKDAKGLVAVPDFVHINTAGGARAAQVIFSGTGATTTKRYEDYTYADQVDLSYSEQRDVIGVSWRNATAANGPLSVYKDRFYLVKDPEGNVYKLRFLSFTPNDGGKRGRPRIEYRLLEPAA